MSSKGANQPQKSLIKKYFLFYTNNSKQMQYNTNSHNNLHRKVLRAWTVNVVTELDNNGRQDKQNQGKYSIYMKGKKITLPNCAVN